MKSNFKPFLILLPLGILAWAGCQTQYPSSYLPSTGTNPGLVINFEGPATLSVNPKLAEANTPGNVIQYPGVGTTTFPSPVTYGSGTFNFVSGAAYTNTAIHVQGTVNDLGDAKYPSISFQVNLEQGPSYYDASLFSGVKFYINVSGSDAAASRSFSIPVAQTSTASNGGTCNPSANPNACYNNFGYTYPNTNGKWLQQVKKFSELARQSYGLATTPPTLTGINLQQVLQLSWSEGDNNGGKAVNVDFSVDEVEFF